MAKNKRIAGIDIGTTKIACIIAETSDNGKINILGFGKAPPQGFSHGVVNNLDKAAESVASAIEEAELSSGTKLAQAGTFVGITGEHLKHIQGIGAIPVKKPSKGITEQDLDKVIEQAQAIRLPNDEQILHVIPTQFIVDGQRGVRNPLGLFGVRLEVEALIVIGAVTAIENIYRMLDQLGVKAKGLVLQSLAASYSVTEPMDKDLGVAVVDIGGVTDISVFKDGELRYSRVINLGGSHITQDIAIGLRTPYNKAEEIKRNHGAAVVNVIENDEPISIDDNGAHANKHISRRLLASIIEPRVEEILLHAEAEIRKTGYADSLSAGVILTGGTSQFSGIAGMAEQIFGLPIKIGYPDGINGNSDAVRNPAYATTVGLIRYGLEGKYLHNRVTPSIASVVKNEFKKWFT
ncbi:MAG: cell division protein FtsA [candidate division WOR-3 bacterium]|nr:cell division protein FtsA [candidate division WOR-3 bacterium]